MQRMREVLTAPRSPWQNPFVERGQTLATDRAHQSLSCMLHPSLYVIHFKGALNSGETQALRHPRFWTPERPPSPMCACLIEWWPKSASVGGLRRWEGF
jgi:hypothetical protein